MILLWKILRHHISGIQLAAFFMTNVVGAFIFLLGIQFYYDVLPLFSQPDHFMKKEYLILSKKVNTLNSFVGKDLTFSVKERKEMENLPFVRSVGIFSASDYEVYGTVDVLNGLAHLSTEMFFESVANNYVDVNSTHWTFDSTKNFLPIIIPRNYLNLYNYGFAEARGLPKISEGMVEMIQMKMRISGNNKQRIFNGQIVGFSNRLNTILVPDDFMRWSNREFGSESNKQPSRVILEVNNSSHPQLISFLHDHHYEQEGEKSDNGKITFFLKLIVSLVSVIGLFIVILSLLLFLLSVYLLIQKNREELQFLMNIGYTARQIAFLYQFIVFLLTFFALLIVLIALCLVRPMYIDELLALWPDYVAGSNLIVFLIDFSLFFFVGSINMIMIRMKIVSLGKRQ